MGPRIEEAVCDVTSSAAALRDTVQVRVAPDNLEGTRPTLETVVNVSVDGKT